MNELTIKKVENPFWICPSCNEFIADGFGADDGDVVPCVQTPTNRMGISLLVGNCPRCPQRLYDLEIAIISELHENERLVLNNFHSWKKRDFYCISDGTVTWCCEHFSGVKQHSLSPLVNWLDFHCIGPWPADLVDGVEEPGYGVMPCSTPLDAWKHPRETSKDMIPKVLSCKIPIIEFDENDIMHFGRWDWMDTEEEKAKWMGINKVR